MSPPLLPSGRQHVLVHGDQRAVVVEVGAGLRSYRAHGRELLDGYAEDERASSARGQPLIPWPNRLRDGRYTWDGEQHQLPLSEPEQSNAIHGLVRWAGWATARQTTGEVELRHVLHPSPGYPFSLELSLAYALGEDGLTVTTTARNAGDAALPYAAGQHPYLAASGSVDDCELQLPAATRVLTDDRGLPTGREDVTGTDVDFRSARRVGGTQIDAAFTDLERDGDGRCWVTLSEPDREVRMWVDRSHPYVELFTGDTVPERQRRRRSLGVEPMTAPPNALADGVDVQRLEPGQSTTSRWGMVAIR
jgi:aldose 1-epimerase